MIHPCPHCRDPIAWAHLCRALAWGSHARPCRGCGAWVNVEPRGLAVLGVTLALLGMSVGLSFFPGWLITLAGSLSLTVAAVFCLRVLRITILNEDRRNCPACGYDLGGAPATGARATCPECGTVVRNFHVESPERAP